MAAGQVSYPDRNPNIGLRGISVALTIGSLDLRLQVWPGMTFRTTLLL